MRDVHVDEVVIFYLFSEVGRIIKIPALPDEARIQIKTAVAGLEPKERFALLGALSQTYRKNPVYGFLVGCKKLRVWKYDSVDVNLVTIKAVNEKVNKALCCSAVNHSLKRFVEYLGLYFKNHPSDDPEGLNEFRPDPTREIYPRGIIAMENRLPTGKIEFEIIDGVHRSVAIAQQGCSLLQAYVGCR